jgi:hypothetical protein
MPHDLTIKNIDAEEPIPPGSPCPGCGQVDDHDTGCVVAFFGSHEAVAAEMDKRNAMVNAILEKNPRIPAVTAMIVAGDMLSAETVARKMRDARDPEPGILFARVGSYARFGLAVDLMEEGVIHRAWFFENIAELWRTSDPDDTDWRFLRVWQTAWRNNDFKPVRDEPRKHRNAIPASGLLTVYRGQRMFDRPGFAWTTDRSIAEKFARGASYRMPIDDGVVIEGEAIASRVLAYITMRGEFEVIVDPEDVSHVSETEMPPHDPD